MKRAIAIIAALGACAVASAAADTVSSSTDSEFRADLNAGAWVKGPNLPEPRQDAAAAVAGGRIYLIGGFGPNYKQVDTTLVLEPPIYTVDVKSTALIDTVDVKSTAPSRLGTWTSAAPIPLAIDHAAACAMGGFLYVVGGRVGRKVSSRLWRYDPSADGWVQLASMPIARYAPMMQPFDGKLYVIGGQTVGGRDELAIEVYDPATDSWSLKKRELELEREDAASTMLGGKIVVVGGHDHDQINLLDCDIYDPQGDQWSSCAHLHQGRADFGLAEVHGRLMAFGGFDLRADQATQTTEISTAQGRGWLGGPWMPSPRHGMSVVVLNNTIYVIGGSAWSGVAPMANVLRWVSPVTRVRLGPRVQHT